MQPTLLLPPRYTTDTNAVSSAAARADRTIERLSTWRVPPVVETGPYWWSGLYGCSPDAVRPVLLRATVQEAQLTDADRSWTSPQKVELLE
jgi:hypothetical protein